MNDAAGDRPPPELERELARLQSEAEAYLDRAATPRWSVDPEDARRSVARLVLAIVDFVRQLLERQAIRRMDAGSLSDEEVERVGLALMRLEETVRELALHFGIPPEEINLDLGPLGRLL